MHLQQGRGETFTSSHLKDLHFPPALSSEAYVVRVASLLCGARELTSFVFGEQWVPFRATDVTDGCEWETRTLEVFERDGGRG